MIKQATKPEVSKDEEEYRKELFPEISLVKKKNVLCTSCNQSVKEAMLRGKIRSHPFLDTLLCEKCYNFYGDGEFSVDEDGSDKYCRWCGQGGTLYLCSTCTGGFCKKCIKRNLPRSALKEVENDDWDCYCCDVKPLYELRAHCWAAKKYAKSIKMTKIDDLITKKRKHGKEIKSSDDEKNENNSSKKAKFQEDVKQNQSQKRKNKLIKVAAIKLADFAADSTKLSELIKKKGIEFKNQKSFGKSVSSLEDVNTMKDKIAKMLKEVEEVAREMRTNLEEYVENWHKVLEAEGENGEDEDKKDEEMEGREVEDRKSEEKEDMETSIAQQSDKEEKKDSDEDMQDKSQENGETDPVKPSNEESSSGDKSDDEKTAEKSDEGSVHVDLYEFMLS